MNEQQLIARVKILQERIDAASKQSDSYKLEQGRHLLRLKAKKPEDVTWSTYVQKHFGMSRVWANTLIRMAEKRTSPKKVRENTRARMQKYRQKQADARMSRDIHSEPDDPSDDCNYDPEALIDSEPVEVSRKRGVMYRIREAAENLRTALRDCRREDCPAEPDVEMLTAAQAAVARGEELVNWLRETLPKIKRVV